MKGIYKGIMQKQQKLIDCFPQPLLDDLIAGRWLPIIGAGMSRNAVVSSGQKMPLWDDLGRALAKEIPDYPYTGALDAISAYVHEYSRVKLVERMSDLLLVDRARPGDAHKAFCAIPFDIVCTTNLEFLIERQYEAGPRYCRPVVDEDQLSTSIRDHAVMLVKVHGDLHHPKRMVITEEDYDRFLERYPLLATYLSNLLINRTAVLIGYSLDDPDFRQIWQIVNERLGSLRRPAYAIMVEAKHNDIARFARRGVKVINLPGTKSKYGDIFAKVFDELREYLTTNIIPASQVTEEEPLQELSLPKDAATRLCFLAVPFSILSYYKENVFPTAQRFGFVPMTAYDVMSPGDNIGAKIEALIERAACVIVDISSPYTIMEMRLARSKLESSKVLIVAERGTAIPSEISRINIITRSSISGTQPDKFLESIGDWFESVAKQISPQLSEEPRRLLANKEYRAAVISSMALLESVLRSQADQNIESSRIWRFKGIRELLQQAQEKEIINSATLAQLTRWWQIRNKAVHTQEPVSANTAREIVNGVLEIIGFIQKRG